MQKLTKSQRELALRGCSVPLKQRWEEESFSGYLCLCAECYALELINPGPAYEVATVFALFYRWEN